MEGTQPSSRRGGSVCRGAPSGMCSAGLGLGGLAAICTHPHTSPCAALSPRLSPRPPTGLLTPWPAVIADPGALRCGGCFTHDCKPNLSSLGLGTGLQTPPAAQRKLRQSGPLGQARHPGAGPAQRWPGDRPPGRCPEESLVCEPQQAGFGQGPGPPRVTGALCPEAQQGESCPSPACLQPGEALPPSLCPPSKLPELHVSGCPVPTRLRGHTVAGWGLSQWPFPLLLQVRSNTWGESSPPTDPPWLPVVQIRPCGLWVVP